jgi:glycosyltransferase involved in cell wall biosynthesis
MTTYNREAFLADTIESVLASTLQDFELIVVDDGSKDRSFEIAQSYAAKDSRIRAFRNETNLGDYLNRNRAASFARGTYLKYLDSDDLIYPWGLGAMVACMKRFPEAGLGLSAIAEPHRPHPTLLSPREAYLEHFTRTDLFGRAPGSAIIRREAFEEVGGFSGRRFVGDTELWLSLARKFGLLRLPRDLVWDRTQGLQEKIYEQGTDVEAVRHELWIGALNHPECPLSQDERAAAWLRLQRTTRQVQMRRLIGAIRNGVRLRHQRSTP